MKAKLLFLVGLSACTPALQAQGVSIYGVVDAGVAYARTSTGVSKTELRHNNLYGTRLGFKGSESLGGGLSAIFNLEMGMKLDDGTLTFAGRTFGREASVGLRNANHRILVGRLVSPLLEGVNRFAATHAGPHLPNQDPQISNSRLDDSVRYTFTGGGFEANAFYSFGVDSVATPIGGVPGGAARARDAAFSVGYSKPDYAVNFVYDRLRGPLTVVSSGVGYMAPSIRPKVSTTGDRAQRYVLAGRMKVGPNSTFFAGHRLLKADFGVNRVTSNLSWLQVRQQVTSQVVIDGGVSYQRLKNIDAKALSFVVQAQYMFSKNTSVYLNAERVKNSGLSVIGVNSNDPVPAGSSQTGVQVGIAHWF